MTVTEQLQASLAITPQKDGPMSTAIARQEPIETVHAPSLLQIAVERGADIVTLKELMVMQEHMESRQAERAFNEAC